MTTEMKVALGIVGLVVVYSLYRHKTVPKTGTGFGADGVFYDKGMATAMTAQATTVARASEGDQAAASDLSRQLAAARIAAADQEKV